MKKTWNRAQLQLQTPQENDMVRSAPRPLLGSMPPNNGSRSGMFVTWFCRSDAPLPDPVLGSGQGGAARPRDRSQPSFRGT